MQELLFTALAIGPSVAVIIATVIYYETQERRRSNNSIDVEIDVETFDCLPKDRRGSHDKD